MRFLNKLQVIDDLLRKPVIGSIEDLSKLPSDKYAQAVLDNYFLSYAKGDQWLPLAQRIAEQNRNRPLAVVPNYLAYLLTCTKERAISAANALCPIATDDWPALLDFASKIGLPEALPLLQLFLQAEPLPPKILLEDSLALLIQQALRLNQERIACAALSRFLEVEPDPRESTPSTSQQPAFVMGLDPSIGTDPLSLGELLSSFIACVSIDCAPSVMNVMSDALSNSIRLSYWPSDREGRIADGHDGSVFWRPAIEEHEQNSDIGYREQLVVAIRDLGELIVSSSGTFEKIDDSFSRHNWAIFKRIKLHLIRKFPTVAGERVCQALADERLRASDTWHEWALLLSEQFRNLACDEQTAILSWMTEERDPSEYVQRYSEIYEGADPTPDGLARWKAERSRKKLAVIKDSIPEDWRNAHSDLCANLDEIEHPTFHYYTSGCTIKHIEKESPKTAEEITTASPCNLVAELAQWREKDPYDGPSEWGLLAELKKAARNEPAKFLSQLTEYRDLALSRHCSILEGIWEAANEGASTDWSQLLIQTKNITQDRILPAALENGGKGDGGITTPVVRAMEVALEKKLPPVELRQAVFHCIAAFLEHPDPRPSTNEAETSPDKLSSQSLNTPRPIAIRCLFAYDEWLRAAHIDDTLQVLQTLERVLKEECTLAARSVFGEKLNWFLRYHPEWTKKHLHELFPPDAPAKGAAVWNCFVTMCGASKIALEIFRPEYERAIENSRQGADEKLSSDWSPHKGLVRHLCAYYWWGLQPIDRPSLVTNFFKMAPANLREYAFNYFGQALDNTKDELPVAVSQRFQALADWRIKVLQASDGDSSERQELQGFVRWVDADKMPVEWSLQKLHEVLTLISGSLNEHQMLPFDFLAKHAEQYPRLTIDCMHELTFAPSRKGKTTPPWWGQEDEAKKVLRVALATKDKDTARQAEEIQDHLLRLGRSEYRNLEPEAE